MRAPVASVTLTTWFALCPPSAGGATAHSEPPVVIRSVAPVYPPWAVGSGMTTVVDLSVLVAADGRVSRVRIAPYTVRNDIMSRRLRASFDSAAMLAVRSWIFRPRMTGGHPVSAWAKVKVTFEDPGDTRTETVGPAMTEIGPPPRVIRRVAPIYPGEARSTCLDGEVALSVWLDDRAVPEHVKIEWPFPVLEPHGAGVGALFDSSAIRAARQWRYQWREGDSLRNRRRASVRFLFVPGDTSLCAPKRTAQITGLVRDSSTGEPIEMARVAVNGTRLGTHTDSMGRYLLAGVTEGVVDILWDALGYERTVARVRVPPGSRALLDASLKPEPGNALQPEPLKGQVGR